MNKKFLIVLVGPTAVGKTRVSLELARHYHSPIISADARQVFKEMSIGTAKPSAAELQVVKHYFIDSHSISEDFNAGMFAAQSEQVISKHFKVKDRLILCGGSGLYIKALLEGFDNIPEIPKEIREEVIQGYEDNGLAWLQGEVAKVDPVFYAQVDQFNPQRLMRALEVYKSSGVSFSSFKSAPRKVLDYEVIKIGLTMYREELYKRIDQRMDEMIEAGLFEEAKALYPFKDLNALQTVGYSEIFGFLDGAYDRGEAVRLLKRNSRRYAKRQLTWFNADKEITWFNPNDIDSIFSFIKEKSAIL